MRKNAEWVANSVDTDQTPLIAASDLGLHCLLMAVYLNTKGKIRNATFLHNSYMYTDNHIKFTLFLDSYPQSVAIKHVLKSKRNWKPCFIVLYSELP